MLSVLGFATGGLVVAGIALAILYHFARPAPAIWRGDASAVPSACTTLVAAHARTYLTFLLCLGTATIGAALGGVGVAAITGQPAGEGWPVGLVAVGLVLLLGNVDMQRRP